MNTKLLATLIVGLATIAGIFPSCLARAQEVPELQEPPAWARAIDMSQGEVDGKHGIGIWPISSLETHDLVGPEGLTVHFMPAGNPDDQVLVFPAGTWILPPQGRYRYWLEGKVAGQAWMSPTPSSASIAHQPFTGRTRGLMRLVKPAGTVALAPGWNLSENQELRLLHTESHLRDGSLFTEMARRVPADLANVQALMPEGTVLAAIYDKKAEKYLALSKPLRVSREEVIFWQPEPPEETTDLIVVLNRPTSCFAAGPEGDDVELALRLADGTLLEPDVKVPSSGRVFGQWYGLEGQSAFLEVRSKSVFLEELEFVLRPGRVENVVADLHPLPSLEVEIDLPAELTSVEGLLLQAFNVEGDLVRQLKAKGDARDLKLKSLPVDTNAIRLEIPPWSFMEAVSFEDRTDQHVVFRPRAHVVSGRIYSGEDPSRAVVSFVVSRDARNGKANHVVAETDEEGRYEAILFRPDHYSVRITQPLRPGLPFRQYVYIPDQLYVEHDFQLPHNLVHIRAIDERSGDGISGARVTANNSFPMEIEPGAVETPLAERPHNSVMQKGETDDDGWLALPPLRPGKVELVVRASGYKMADRKFDVSADERPREIVVPLVSAGNQTTLNLIGPDGQPVAGAELIGLGAHSDHPEWRGTTDREGDCEIPEHLVGSLLLVRAPTAAFLVSPWTIEHASQDTTTWQLRPAAPPLEVNIHRPWGDPASRAKIAIWQDGRLLSGSILRWLTGFSNSDRYGKWRVSNLPQGPLSVVARVANDPSSLPPAVATNISFPWRTDPVVVTIE